MEEALRALLLANTALAALVGTRITWLQRPQAAALPAITLQGVSAPRDYTMTGRDGLVGHLVQIDVWADSYASMKSVSRAIVTALDGPFADPLRVALIINERETMEAADGPDGLGSTTIFNTSLDVRVWSTEAI